MKKRIAALLLALVMVLSLMPTAVFAEDHANQVRVIVENTTYPAADGAPWDGTLVDEWVELSADSTMMNCVVAALDKHGYKQTGAENNYISKINGLEEFDGGFMSGWMGTLNDWFTNEGFGGFTVANGKLEAGDEIRIMYTCAYGDDLGGSWSNNETTVKALTFSAGTLSPTFDKETYEYTLTVPADVTAVMVTPTASNKNFQVRTSVDGTEYKRTAMVPVADGKQIVVKCGDPSWPSMNGSATPHTYTITVKQDQQTRNAIDLINSIGSVSLNSKAAIQAARTAYNALTEEQKALISADVLKLLTDAETAYAALENAGTNNGGTGGGFGTKTDSTKTDSTKTDGEAIHSAKTADAGIALYVGMSLLAAMGGAVVIGRKKRAN